MPGSGGRVGDLVTKAASYYLDELETVLQLIWWRDFGKFTQILASVGVAVQRIMIIGGHGAGKTTLALKLGEITGLPVIHIDKSYHLPRWKQRQLETVLNELENHANSARWIMDGDDFRSFGPRLKRADFIIYLHVSTFRRVARTIKRSISSFNKTRVDLPDGCQGRFTFDSLKWAAVGYPFFMRPAMHRAIAKDAGDVPVFHVRSEADHRKLEALLSENR